MGNNYDKISRIRQGYSTGWWQSFKGDHEKKEEKKTGKNKNLFLGKFLIGWSRYFVLFKFVLQLK